MNTSFLELLDKNIPVNTRIDNWSVDNKIQIPYYTYLGIVNQKCILLHPETNKEIKISEKSFQYLYKNWQKYKTGDVLRNQLRKLDRSTTYTICIFKYLEDHSIL